MEFASAYVEPMIDKNKQTNSPSWKPPEDAEHILALNNLRVEPRRAGGTAEGPSIVMACASDVGSKPLTGARRGTLSISLITRA